MVSDSAPVPGKEAALRLNLEVPTGSVWSVKLVEARPGPRDPFQPNSYSGRSPVHSTTQGNNKAVIALTITCDQDPKGKFTA